MGKMIYLCPKYHCDRPADMIYLVTIVLKDWYFFLVHHEYNVGGDIANQSQVVVTRTGTGKSQ